MMNHPQKGIFTPVRNEPLTGRNANIQPTMFKRKQIFDKAPTQRFETPFSGYSFTGSSVTDNNSLARSQVSQFSQQSVIRLIKQELQKNGLNSMSETSQQSLKYKNELNILRIEIRGIKESYHEFNKSFKKKLEQQNDTILDLKKQLNNQNRDNSLYRDDMSAQLVQKIQEVEQGIAVKMRLIFTKMQEDLRKELTNYANREFVPTSFLDDLDKQLNQLDDRIANIESQYEANKTQGQKQSMASSKIDRDTSLILSAGSQLKIKQFERDLVNLKKQLDQKSEQIKEIDQSIQSKHETYSKDLKQVKQTIIELATSSKERQNEYEKFKANLESQIESDKKKLLEKIETDIEVMTKNLNHDIALKSLTLSNSIEPQNFKKKPQSTSILLENCETQNADCKFQETRDESKLSALSNSTNRNSTEVFTNDQAHQMNSLSPNHEKNSSTGRQSLPNSKDSPKKTKKITITYGSGQRSIMQPVQQDPLVGKEDLPASVNSNIIQSSNVLPSKDQEDANALYKVDKDGYLMDNNNKYILSSSNSMIFISQQQIQAMEKTSLIKVERWSMP